MLGKLKEKQNWTLVDSFALTFRSLVLLGVHSTLDTDRKKVIAISMMWGGMVLYWFWESCLISYLIMPIKDVPFHSLEEFYVQTNMKVVLSEECTLFKVEDLGYILLSIKSVFYFYIFIHKTLEELAII